jgi:hypothetical protein
MVLKLISITSSEKIWTTCFMQHRNKWQIPKNEIANLKFLKRLEILKKKIGCFLAIKMSDYCIVISKLFYFLTYVAIIKLSVCSANLYWRRLLKERGVIIIIVIIG